MVLILGVDHSEVGPRPIYTFCQNFVNLFIKLCMKAKAEGPIFNFLAKFIKHKL
jgi:hypothetical protein